MAERSDIRTSVILPEDQYARLKALASRNDVSVAWVIRHAIATLLEEYGDQGELPLLERGR